MWLRAGVVVTLLFAGLAPSSAQDDGPPPYVLPPIDHIDPLLMPADPPSPSAITNSQPGFPWEGEPQGQANARFDHD
jgi:hypothetical protein